MQRACVDEAFKSPLTIVLSYVCWAEQKKSKWRCCRHESLEHSTQYICCSCIMRQTGHRQLGLLYSVGTTILCSALTIHAIILIPCSCIDCEASLAGTCNPQKKGERRFSGFQRASRIANYWVDPTKRVKERGKKAKRFSSICCSRFDG